MPLVIDASCLAELLLGTRVGEKVEPFLRASEGRVHLPHLADTETLSVLRGLTLGGHVLEPRAEQAVHDLRDFPARRWPATVTMERVWELRGNVTAYDATYVALAELLEARFLTCDHKLARSMQGVARCEVTAVD